MGNNNINSRHISEDKKRQSKASSITVISFCIIKLYRTHVLDILFITGMNPDMESSNTLQG